MELMDLLKDIHMNQFNLYKNLLYSFDIKNCNDRIKDILEDNLLSKEKKVKRVLGLILLYQSQNTIARVLYEQTNDAYYLRIFIKYKYEFFKNIEQFYSILLSFNIGILDKNIIKRKLKIYLHVSKKNSNQEIFLRKKYVLLMNILEEEIKKINLLFKGSTYEKYDIRKKFYVKNKKIIKEIFNEIFIIRKRKENYYYFSNYTEFQLSKIGRISFFQHDNFQLREIAFNTLQDTFKYTKKYYKCLFKTETFDEYFQEVYLSENFKKYSIDIEEVIDILKIMENLPATIGNFAKLILKEKLYCVQDNNIEKDNFCFWIERIKKPYIYLQGYNGKIRISSIFHEFGHAYALYHNREHSENVFLGLYGEIKELFSIGMEFLCMQYFIKWGVLRKEYKLDFFCESLSYLPYAFAVEEFQDYIYSPNYRLEDADNVWIMLSKKYEIFDEQDKDSIWIKDRNFIFGPYELGNYVLAQIYIFYYFIIFEKNFQSYYIFMCEQKIDIILNDLKKVLNEGNESFQVINNYFYEKLQT